MCICEFFCCCCAPSVCLLKLWLFVTLSLSIYIGQFDEVISCPSAKIRSINYNKFLSIIYFNQSYMVHEYIPPNKTMDHVWCSKRVRKKEQRRMREAKKNEKLKNCTKNKYKIKQTIMKMNHFNPFDK